MSEEMCTCNNVPASQCTCDEGCVCGCKAMPEEETSTEESGMENLGESEVGEE